MSIKILTSREFNQDVSKAKRLATEGAVYITDRGHPAHVLLTMEEYERLTKKQENIVQLLSMPVVAEIEFELKKLSKDLFNPADLS